MLLSDLGHSMYINILGQYTLSAFFSVLQNWFKLVYGQGRAGQGRAGQGRAHKGLNSPKGSQTSSQGQCH